MFSFGAGKLATTYSIEIFFFWFLVVLMTVNAIFLGLLHFTYPKDVETASGAREQERLAALESQEG